MSQSEKLKELGEIWDNLSESDREIFEARLTITVNSIVRELEIERQKPRAMPPEFSKTFDIGNRYNMSREELNDFVDILSNDERDALESDISRVLRDETAKEIAENGSLSWDEFLENERAKDRDVELAKYEITEEHITALAKNSIEAVKQYRKEQKNKPGDKK